ncbi:spore coat protein U domain-containing protein [Massilia sp. TWR1-2-2]|uniref:spore coat protein U domain-containing protein n=1 Tax=Massilia sp. TWR1-2-2 TaxID=2804584 RepID=UPI003CEC7766
MALLAVAAGARAQSCTVVQGATLVFPPVVALASGGSPTTDTGHSFKVSCDPSVVSTLRLHSVSPRLMSNSIHQLPFNLSLSSGAASNDLATAAPGTPVTITRDGQGQVVVLYAKIYAASFRSLPGGAYSATLTLTLEY